ncbi:MAG TPA: type I restriction endonuclease [Caldilineaceae bacterium]|nr:type I restriction endonuclease [Caldilineaceae bacterium]
MTDKHLETKYEAEMVAHLVEEGWVEGDPAEYDRKLALYPEDLIGWLKETQAEEWAKLAAFHNGDTEQLLLQRVVTLMDKEGSLALLRHGFKHGNARFQLCQFKPGHHFNPETLARYKKVRCRVVRQVHYSLHNENSIDLVLFINGIPVATLELKTDFTQSINDAIKQYKNDRLPKDPATRAEEPLLAFKRRSLVHFAVSTDEVYMTTKLAGANTYFLPFNLGYNQGAGNPPNPHGYRTSYLWERILTREAWLDIIGRFVHLERKTVEDDFGRKRTKETMIFPRFHQREVVTQLVEAARVEHAGYRYLVQHSAGSGKSNSIAWLAHQLASLHDAAGKKVFDSIIIITDRTVLDKQLQDTVYQIEHKEGVVVRITDREVKSKQLVKALVDRAPVIIVTIQTFPFVLEAIQEQVSLKERTFAVIADEAHSSQSGGTVAKLKQVLTAEQIEEGVEVSAEDVMVASMEARKPPANVSFFAFTATPKAKTIELFGRPGADGIPTPFHVYSMQQAIEEGFILDVLKNYLPYKLAYRLAHRGKSYDDEEIEQSEGLKQLARWVRLHPHNIRSKVAIIVEHFRANIAWQLNGQAKVMVVTGSRKEAVRYKLAMEEYIKEQGYKHGVLVAFSGEVIDGESGPDSFSEANMNDLHGQDLREVFDRPEYQILIVANKYQTGFDQPKLVAMYVDKKLSGVSAVQTLSRLNRTETGKTDTYVLDFVNHPDEILAAFAPYYRTAELATVSDPNVIHDLHSKLDAAHIYTRSEVEAFARAYFDPKGKQEQLQAYVAPAVDRFRDRYVQAKEDGDRAELDALEIFRKDLSSFVRAYEFLSQIFPYDDSDLEKQYAFCKHLIPWLKTGKDGKQLDLSAVELTHYRLQELDKRRLRVKDVDGEYKLKPLTEVGTAMPHDPNLATLSAIIEQLNTLFSGELSEADLVTYVRHITGKMLENDVLAKQAASNTKEQFALGDFSGVFEDTVIDGLDNYRSMAEQVLTSTATRKGFERLVLDMVYRGFEQMRQGQQAAK